MDVETEERLELEYFYQRKLQAQKDRAEIANQYVRGCTLMNGGGSVALLAFSGGIIKADQFAFLAPWVALAITAFVLGLVSAALANRYRGKVSLKVDAKEALKDETKEAPLRKEIKALSGLSHGFQIGAIVCFFFGCMIFATSIFLEFGPPKFSAQGESAHDLVKDF